MVFWLRWLTFQDLSRNSFHCVVDAQWSISHAWHVLIGNLDNVGCVHKNECFDMWPLCLRWCTFLRGGLSCWGLRLCATFMYLPAFFLLRIVDIPPNYWPVSHASWAECWMPHFYETIRDVRVPGLRLVNTEHRFQGSVVKGVQPSPDSLACLFAF